jgi:hypothetical protein
MREILTAAKEESANHADPGRDEERFHRTGLHTIFEGLFEIGELTSAVCDVIAGRFANGIDLLLRRVFRFHAQVLYALHHLVQLAADAGMTTILGGMSGLTRGSIRRGTHNDNPFQKKSVRSNIR